MAAKKKPAAKKVVKKAAKVVKKVATKKPAAKKAVVKKPAVKKTAAQKNMAKKAVAKAAARPAVIDTQRAVEQFLYQQSEILDTRQWQSFIDLFTPDGVYWVPITLEQTEWEGSPSIFAEDKLMMEVRMRRVLHPNAWSQAPMWATNHLISNVVIEKETATEVQVRSRFHLMELRRDTVRHFGGTYRHTLVKSGGGYKIKLQRVDMFNSQAPYDYVLQIWV
jgi:3-phenylpropionate/cinnamic acid dioxygenase small subunit